LLLASPTVTNTCSSSSRSACLVLGARREAAQRRAALDEDPGDPQLVDVRAVVVLGVGDRRLERLADIPPPSSA